MKPEMEKRIELSGKFLEELICKNWQITVRIFFIKLGTKAVSYIERECQDISNSNKISKLFFIKLIIAKK